MDNIILGNNNTVYKVGGNDCSIYLGTTLLYPHITPTGGTKFSAQYNDSTSYSADCDSNTTLIIYDVSASTKPNSAMTDAVIGDCITVIGVSCFSGCTSLSSVTISSGVTAIGDNAFYQCGSLSSIAFPDSMASIGENVFWGCSSLQSLTIPNNVASIGQSAFSRCSVLTTCTIGSGITSIGANAFYNCSSLLSITVEATTPPTLGYYALGDTNNCPIYVPASSLSAYQSAWSTYASRIQAITP